MNAKQLLLKLKSLGLDITALKNKDISLEEQITALKDQVGGSGVNEAIQSAIAEFEKLVDQKDQSVLATIRQEIQTAATALETKINAKLDTKSDLGHIHNASEITESEEKQFVSASKKTQYDENTIYNNAMETVNSIGGISAGTSFNNMPVNELLTKLLYPYVAPGLSVSGTPNGGTFEKGDNKTITSVRAIVTKKSEKISKIEVKDGSNIIGTKDANEVQNGGTFDFATNVAVDSVNKQLEVVVTDAANKVVKASTGGFTFVYPYYFGVCNADSTSLSQDDIKAMTKKIEGKGNKSYTYTTNNQRFVIAYPKAHGDLKTIIDPNGFDITPSFAKTEIAITGLDGTAQAYLVYVGSANTNTDFAVKFNY